MPVPTFDLNECVRDRQAKESSLLHKLTQDLCEHGILRIENHGLSSTILEQHFNEFNAFFMREDKQEKGKYRINADIFNYHYGYSFPFNKAYESFNLPKKSTNSQVDPIHEQLQIPQYPQLNQRHEDIHTILSDLALLFVRLLSVAYRWNEQIYAEITQQATNTLGFFKYYPRTMPFRHDGHRHNSFLSFIVIQSDDDELEYQLADGTWEQVNGGKKNQEPYVLYLLIGELFQVMSGDAVLACTHRRRISDQSRESMLYFFTPAEEYKLRVLPPWSQQNDKKVVDSLNVKQWINQSVLSEIIAFNRLNGVKRRKGHE